MIIICNRIEEESKKAPEQSGVLNQTMPRAWCAKGMLEILLVVFIIILLLSLFLFKSVKV